MCARIFCVLHKHFSSCHENSNGQHVLVRVRASKIRINTKDLNRGALTGCTSCFVVINKQINIARNWPCMVFTFSRILALQFSSTATYATSSTLTKPREKKTPIQSQFKRLSYSITRIVLFLLERVIKHSTPTHTSFDVLCTITGANIGFYLHPSWNWKMLWCWSSSLSAINLAYAMALRYRGLHCLHTKRIPKEKQWK